MRRTSLTINIIILTLLNSLSIKALSGSQEPARNMQTLEYKTVDTVDISRYQGLWYEIARKTQWFEKGMTDVTALYTPKGKYIEVINSGVKKGKYKETKGKATVVKGSGNSKLKVMFFWPFKGDYWIIDLAPDYSWAVVSNKKKTSLWILSRTPQMEPYIIQEIVDRLRAWGFDLSDIEYPSQEKHR